MVRIIRTAFVATALAALSIPAHAQESTTSSADQDGRRRGAGLMRRGGEITTATFEQYWDRTQQVELQAAGIPAEKIAQLKQMELETRMALSRGERPDLKALSQKRREILTPEEMVKISEIRRARRDGAGSRRDGMTTGTRGANQPSDATTTPTTANE